MPEPVGTDSLTVKCGPFRNSGLRISLALSSGSSSNEFASIGEALGAFWPKVGRITPTKIDNERESALFNYLRPECCLRPTRPIRRRFLANPSPDYIGPSPGR